MVLECVHPTKQRKTNSQYDAVKRSIIDFTIECFSNYLHPPTTSLPLYELFIFTDHESVKQHIVGSPRATLHTALNSPSCYLQCSCCATDVKDEIISTMPDICIGYKLHLECGRLINLYDWLHAFRHVTSTVANGTSDAEAEEDTIEIEPEIQARFTSMVSELQHLGFIKSSNKKRDHVTRLTW
ncbi:origin recognition complex subunit 3-like [Ctenocephalides felis]|uniref:origin recognition complex subunit 3-like n=1 Tax=Ctenocephalides felis TaxID=7515 RepID=UPI000E6E2F87|nr:origin recognition complex subunit 3-like [Ctenocephalides felis]